MNIPYSAEDQQLLELAGWVFDAPDYISIPDDYDGCFATGHKNIQHIIDGLRARFQTYTELSAEIREFMQSSIIFNYDRCNGIDMEADMMEFVRACIAKYAGKPMWNNRPVA
jgi:hypothetical protein